MAERNGRSMEEEIRQILRAATAGGAVRSRQLGSEIAARFAGVGLDAALPELRDEGVRPATFES
jgi:plasmid stability protein